MCDVFSQSLKTARCLGHVVKHFFVTTDPYKAQVISWSLLLWMCCKTYRIYGTCYQWSMSVEISGLALITWSWLSISVSHRRYYPCRL